MAREPIKDFSGIILGYREEQPNGDIVATTFLGKILGRYVKADNVTKNFLGQIVSRGDTTAALIMNEKR